jgi:hypothetical protein
VGALGLGAVAFFATGCAGSSDQTSQELAKMQEQVSALRAETAALSERMEALEAHPAAATQAAAPPPEPAEDPRPPLRVVRLGPGDAPAEVASYDANASDGPPEKRVKIRSTANGLVQEDVTGDEAASSSDPKRSPPPDKKKKADAPKTDAKKTDAPKTDAKKN